MTVSIPNGPLMMEDAHEGYGDCKAEKQKGKQWIRDGRK